MIRPWSRDEAKWWVQYAIVPVAGPLIVAIVTEWVRARRSKEEPIK